MRPSHGTISVAGLMPFAPSFDTVGVLAASMDVLTRAATVLLACDYTGETSIGDIHLISETMEIADAEVRAAMAATAHELKELFPGKIRETSMRAIDGESAEKGLDAWLDAYCTIQWAEIWSSLGTWIDEVKPAFGPRTEANFRLTRNLDRSKIGAAVGRRERYFRRLQDFLGPGGLLLMPTSPTLAPLKGSPVVSRTDRSGTAYYPRTLSFTAVAGIGRLPQISIPALEVGGVPLGFSLLAAHGRDAHLLNAAQAIFSRL
jgi:amidase